MRILVFYPYIPFPLDRGTHHRTFHLLQELAAVHEVDFLALTQNGEGTEHLDIFRSFCRRVDFFSFDHPAWQKLFPGRLFNPLPASVAHWTIPGLPEKIRLMVEAGKHDAVHICDIVLVQYFLGHHLDLPVVVDRSRVDLQYQLMEGRHLKFGLKDKILRGEGYLKMLLYERKVAARTAMQIVCGPDDDLFIKRHISNKAVVKVLVNGVDLDFFNPQSAPDQRAEKPCILFCGAMDYNPNIDALNWYFSEIHLRLKDLVPELEVLIVGKNPVETVRKHGLLGGVRVTGGVPDVRPYYRRAWLQIVPLRIGGGTRLKIVESLAMGTPVISTTIGAQGLDLCNNRDVLLADSVESFAAETARALRDENLRSELERNGTETAHARFSWISLGQELNAAYLERFGRCERNLVKPGQR